MNKEVLPSEMGMRRTKDLCVLENSPLFQGISKATLDTIWSFLRTITVPRRTFFLPPEPNGAIHMLMSGRMKKVRLSSRGRELILEIIEPGEVLGELSILGEEPQDVMAEAMEDSCVGVLPRQKFDELLRGEPGLGMRIAKLMAQRRRDMEKRLEGLVFKTVPGRLAHLLLHLSRVYGVPDNRGTLLRIRLSQQDLGNLIGASREVVSLTLAHFRRQGLIDRRGRQLVICRPQPLAQI